MLPSIGAISHFAHQVLKINRAKRQQTPLDSPRGFSPGIDHYTETDPTVSKWLLSLVPTKEGLLRYFRSILVCLQWLPRYNLRWLIGDSIAGLTVGFVVIPQAMAYALLATLSPEYGLYTSFVGAALYWLFGTSKDIVIGTTAVGSLLVGSVITSVQEQRPDIYTREEIAKSLSAVSGMILLFIGLFRLGWIIEFVPYVSISAFVTAASITIMATQFPVAMGIPGVNTREAPYLVIINSLKGLPRTHVDASIGLSSIVLLYVVRGFCDRMEVRQPSRQRMWSIISSLRLTFAMLLYTFISWLINRNNPRGQSPFRIVGVIERGFKHAGPPSLDGDLVMLVLPRLPAILIILVIEHIAIAKSFGRLFDYTIIPSQEILAQGASNLFGTFVGGYVCTGSFGASAVLSKAGVRTPMAGLFSALILVLALYALTAVFYYIPMAALAGLIIHAVANLVTSPRTLAKYWKFSPPELIIWVTGVAVALFVSLEVSIYVTIAVSLVLLLIRLARTKGRFMGQVHVHRAIGLPKTPTREEHEDHASSSTAATTEPAEPPTTAHVQPSEDDGSRTIFLPLDRQDASNPRVAVEPVYPGVFVYRFPEGLNYVNQAHHTARLIAHVKRDTRRASRGEESCDGNTRRPSDRLWCDDPGPSSEKASTTASTPAPPATPTHPETPDQRPSTPPSQHHQRQEELPVLRAIVLDCSAVNNVDITAVQGLVDVRNALDKHVCGSGGCCDDGEHEGERVEWHFAGLSNRWARRALVAAGFGVAHSRTGTSRPGRGADARAVGGEQETAAQGAEVRVQVGEDSVPDWESPVFLIANSLDGCVTADDNRATGARVRPRRSDEEEGWVDGKVGAAVLYSADRPLFHVDLVDAVDAAVRYAKRMEEREKARTG